jgi:hypothetical protein
MNAVAALTALITTLTVATSPAPRPSPFGAVVDRVAGMVSDPSAQSLAQAHGLQLLDVTWEDTGRSEGSSVGPNISDVTIEVVSEGGRKLALMPVLRFPNFSDKTADVKLDRIFLRVGNELGRDAGQVISLKQLLAEPGRYLSLPAAGRIQGGTLLAPRDSHALVSAQAAFLPVPRGGAATFHPVIFNYQSSAGHPAVLTILVTRQGTSMTIVDNARDTVSGRASWGQRLFFNQGGQRAPLTAERRADVQASGTTMNGESAASLGEDANLLLLVQVPLVIARPPARSWSWGAGSAAPAAKSAAPSMAMEQKASDMDTAVLGHGELQGPFTELAGLTIQRDARFPVRVTAQFYQATATGEVTGADMQRLASTIDAVYSKGDYVGSLVVPSPEDRSRPTAWQQPHPAPWEGACAAWACEYPGLAERSGLRCCPTPPAPLPPIGFR